MVERYRQSVNPVMPETGVMDSGGQSLAMDLANAAKRVQSTAYEFGAGLRAQEGDAAGAKAGKNAKPIGGLGAMTPYGKAYNSAAEASYANAMELDIIQTMDRLDDEHEGDVVGWSMAADGYKRGLLEQVPEAYRPRIASMIDARQVASGTRIRRQEEADFRNKTLAAFNESLPLRAKNAIDSAVALPREAGDAIIKDAIAENDAQLEALLSDRIIDPTEAVKQRAAFTAALDAGLTEGRVNEVVDDLMNQARSSVTKGDAMLADLSGFGLTPDEEQLVREGYKKQRELLQWERTRQYAEQTADVSARLAAGDTSLEVENASDRLYDLGASSVDEYQGFKSTIARNRKEAAEKAATINEFDARGGNFDPGSANDRKLVSAKFDDEMAKAGYAPGSPQFKQAAVGYASRYGILPASAESWARRSILQGDPNAVALGSTFLKQVRESNPVAWDYNRDPKLVAFSELVADSVAANIPPEQAVQKAEKLVYTMDEARKTALTAKYNHDKVFDGDRSALQTLLNKDDRFDRSWVAGAPAPDAQTQDEYSRLVRTFYMLNDGDLAAARKQAGQALLSSGYGYSQVNGKPEVLKYAPEVTRPWLPVQAIREDIAKTMRDVQIRKEAVDPAGFPIDLSRPIIKNPDGTFSTEETISVGFGGRTYNIPTIWDGKRVAPEVAVENAKAALRRGEVFPNFATVEEAKAAAPLRSKAIGDIRARVTSMPLPDVSKIEIGPIGVTEATKGARWGLFTTDEYGNVDQVRGPDNRPIVYELPGADVAAEYQAKYAAQKEAEARAARDARLSDPAFGVSPTTLPGLNPIGDAPMPKIDLPKMPPATNLFSDPSIKPIFKTEKRKPLPPAKDRPMIGGKK